MGWSGLMLLAFLLPCSWRGSLGRAARKSRGREDSGASNSHILPVIALERWADLEHLIVVSGVLMDAPHSTDS